MLDLEGVLRLGNRHLDRIGKLHRLRYLSIRRRNYIWYLPKSIGNLSHLQTLDIKGTHISELPTTITKLRKLQHLRTTRDFMRAQEKNDMFIDDYRRVYGLHRLSLLRAKNSERQTGCTILLPQILRMCLRQATLLRSLVESFWSAQHSELGLSLHDTLNLHRALWVCLHNDTNGF